MTWRIDPKTSTRKGYPRHQALADGIAAELMDTITDAMAAHPRSQQKLIGPSEIGIPCERAILHKLNQDDEPDRGPAWKPAVGTAVHAQLEEWFSTDRKVADGWKTEERVTVGTIGGTPIDGSTDLYGGGAVIDWKIVGDYKLKLVRRSGPGPQYRAQAHTYGRGWEDDGFAVEIVMIAFIPRDGELNDAFFWWEPYDRHIADEALRRCEHLWTVLKAVGIDAAVKLFPPCTDRFCPWGCVEERRAAEPPRTAAQIFS